MICSLIDCQENFSFPPPGEDFHVGNCSDDVEKVIRFIYGNASLVAKITPSYKEENII